MVGSISLNMNNSEQIIFQNFYITLEINQDLNPNFETRFPRGYHKEIEAILTEKSLFKNIT